MVELVVVVMLMLLITGIAISAFRDRSFFVSVNDVVGDIKLTCASLRQTASFQNRKTGIWFDPKKRELCSEEGEILLPDDLKILIGGEDITQSGEKYNLFWIFPDGSGEEQKVIFETPSEKCTVFLSPLTGRIISQNEAM